MTKPKRTFKMDQKNVDSMPGCACNYGHPNEAALLGGYDCSSCVFAESCKECSKRKGKK